MGPKKAGGKDEEEDHSTKDLSTLYKKIAKENEAMISNVLVAKLKEVDDEALHLTEALINEKVGEAGTKAFTSALTKVK